MKKQSFLKGSAILLGMVLLTKAIGLAYKIPLTRILGGSGMAYYSGAFAVCTPLLAAAVSGITTAVARLTAESFALGRYANARKIRRCALLVYSLEGLTAAVVLSAASLPLAESFLHDSRAVWTVLALAPAIVFSALLNAERGYYEGLRNMLPTARSEILETVIRAALGLAGAVSVLKYAQSSFKSSHGAFGCFFPTSDDARAAALPIAAAAAIFASSAATACAFLYTVISGRRCGDGMTKAMLRSDPVTDQSSRIMKQLFSFSLPIAGAAVITTLTSTIDLLTVSRGISRAIAAGMPAAADLPADRLPDFMYGSYTGLALMVTSLVPTFTAMFGKTSSAPLTEALSKRDQKALSAQVSRLLSVTALTAFPCGAAAAVMPKELLSFLFSGRTNEIEAASAPMGILAFACIFSAFSLPCLTALQTLGCKAAPIVLMLLGGGVKLALNLLLIPRPELGLKGAALATLMSQGIICISAAALLLRRTKTSLRPGKTVFPPLFAAFLSASAARLVTDRCRALTAPDSRFACAAGLCCCAAVYLTALWMMDMIPKSSVRAYFSKKFGKTY